jgi:hypothetical protein
LVVTVWGVARRREPPHGRPKLLDVDRRVPVGDHPELVGDHGSIMPRAWAAYDRSPCEGGLLVDATRYPLTAEVAGELFTADSFEHGLRVILAGMATLKS